MKDTTSQPNMHEILAKATNAKLDPRITTFDEQMKREISRVRSKTEKAVKAAEDRLTESVELTRSAAFREATRTDSDLRETLAKVAREAGQARKELHAQRALFTAKATSGTSAKAAARKKTVKQPE